MNDYQPIECNLHDELELLCLQRRTVSVQLRDGTGVDGIAVDWISAQHKSEYLIVNSSAGQKRVRLDRIVAIETPDAGGVLQTLRFQA